MLYKKSRYHGYALISSHPGEVGGVGGDPGETARDLPTFFANSWLGTRVLDRFCTSEARYTGKTRRICNIDAISKMKDPDRGD